MDEEKTWILQAQQGSDEAFTTLVETYQKPVYNLCYRMLGESDWAEDAAQESFLRAYQNLHRYDVKRSFATWLLSIAAHYCIDRLRRKKLPTFSLHDDEGTPREYIPDLSAVNPEKQLSVVSKEKIFRIYFKVLAKLTGLRSFCDIGTMLQKWKYPKLSP